MSIAPDVTSVPEQGSTPPAPFFSIHVLAPVALCVVAAQATLVMPLLVGEAARRLSLDTPHTGLLASAAMAGASSAAGLLIFLIRRLNWKLIGLGLLLVEILAYSCLATMPSYDPALLAMGGLGFGFGGLLGLTQAAMAESGHQTRALGLALALMGLLGSGLAALSSLLAVRSSLLILLICVCVLALPAVTRLEGLAPRAPSINDPGTAARAAGGMRFILAVLAYGVINLANGGFWPLVERAATAAGRPSAIVNEAVSLSLLASTIGGFAALLLGRRAGIAAPLALTGISLAASLVGIVTHAGDGTFVVALIAFGFVWNFGPPYQLPVITSFDPEGRGMPAAVLAMKIFMAIGPYAYGIIAERAGFGAAGAAAASAALVATLVLVLLATTIRVPTTSLSDLQERHV